MVAIGFIEAFVEIFNVIAAVGIIFFCGLILFKVHKLKKNVLKARLFLNDTILRQTWLYISIAGASFALNTLLRFAGSMTAIGDFLSNYYLLELTQLIFLVAFIHAIYSWYLFMSEHHYNA